MIATAEGFTAEQASAIEARHGDLLLDASAGAGKTSVLVERFARAVVEDGVDVSAILAITFTDKAAAELRDRIRARLRELGDEEAARATEGAFISTIHGFCSRVLRTSALAAGIDPSFEVLDEMQTARLAREAFDAALEQLAAESPAGVELIAGYGVIPLRKAILATHGELRSRGEGQPALPPWPPGPDLDAPREALERAAAAALAELAALDQPSTKVVQAIERLERCPGVIAAPEPWPGDLDRVCLPGGNGAALSSETCLAYTEALERFRTACEQRASAATLELLDRLLRSFARIFAEQKLAHAALDFADLELMARDLLAADSSLRERYAERFAHVMVDELQDTNAVQLELIDSIARQNLFMVGDALQSIYAFRHADVELFEDRRKLLAARGAQQTLMINFRSRPEILTALNAGFGSEEAFGERFTPLIAGRQADHASDPVVELLIAERGADWDDEGLAAPWRIAEARALADRVRELINAGATAGDIVLLIRATTDMRAYERALEERGVPTYVIGGRGYWAHPQVVDFVAYLAALANPRDEQALYTVLASPLVGVSADTLVLLAAAARESGRDPWWTLSSGELDAPDRERLEMFAAWFAQERAASGRLTVDELIERALERTGYDLAMLALPGGQRRLANVRKLMRLAREYESGVRNDLRGFLEFIDERKVAAARDARESEAPVESEGLDAVRLMTIHRAKGLEFPIVCVADLGRGPRFPGVLLRVGSDGRLGLRIARPGTGKLRPALEFEALGEEAKQAEAAEERRLFYVAMTRAQERLILSGAAKLEPWTGGGGGAPIGWIAPAFVPELPARVEAGVESGTSERGVAWRVTRPSGERLLSPGIPGAVVAAGAPPAEIARTSTGGASAPPVTHLSYTALGEYARCGYRFYLERVLGLPRTDEAEPPIGGDGGGLSGAERGVLAHALLEQLDLSHPGRPSAEAIVETAACARLTPAPAEIAELQALIDGFSGSELCRRLAAAEDVRREERFGFLLLGSGLPVTGVFDVLAREGDRVLVVDYKSDRLVGEEPAAVVERQYSVQRLVYALAALLGGAAQVEVAHVFLELPDEPVSVVYLAAEIPELERRLGVIARGVLDRDFGVSPVPSRTVCASCPGEGGLCSWPLQMTRRENTDALF